MKGISERGADGVKRRFKVRWNQGVFQEQQINMPMDNKRLKRYVSVLIKMKETFERKAYLKFRCTEKPIIARRFHATQRVNE